MMNRVYICDGCQYQSTMGEQEEGTPEWYIRTEVTINTGEKPIPPNVYHLCGDCVMRLQEKANPTYWNAKVEMNTVGSSRPIGAPNEYAKVDSRERANQANAKW